MNGYVVVEGHGEVEAITSLLFNLASDLGLPPIYWRPPMRKAVTSERVAAEVCAILRTKRDAECLLVLRDEDDGCPATAGPELAGWLRTQQLPFPAAVTLLHREYEALFLPCVEQMAGQPLTTAGISRPGLNPGTTFDGDPEAIRDVKGWLSQHFPAGHRYKPTTDQLPMTRMLDFGVLRASGMPCFGTLERCLRFLTSTSAGDVYPSPGP